VIDSAVERGHEFVEKGKESLREQASENLIGVFGCGGLCA
jgi:hypothetical protein